MCGYAATPSQEIPASSAFRRYWKAAHEAVPCSAAALQHWQAWLSDVIPQRIVPEEPWMTSSLTTAAAVGS